MAFATVWNCYDFKHEGRYRYVGMHANDVLNLLTSGGLIASLGLPQDAAAVALDVCTNGTGRIRLWVYHPAFDPLPAKVVLGTADPAEIEETCRVLARTYVVQPLTSAILKGTEN